MQHPLQQLGFLQPEERIPEGREHEQASYQSAKFNVTELSLPREFWGNNYAHVILTSEADNLSTDDKKLLEDCGLVGCHSSSSNDLSVHARIDSTGYVRLLWESSEEDDKNSHAAIFGNLVKRQKQNRARGQLIHSSVTWSLFASAVEGSDLNTTEGNFVPTARCIQHTKERQLVTRSGLQRPPCCVCHLHPERAMIAPVSVQIVYQNSTSASTPLQG